MRKIYCSFILVLLSFIIGACSVTGGLGTEKMEGTERTDSTQIPEVMATSDSSNDSIINAYLTVIKDIYNRDEGLNGSIKTIAFDLEGANNLSKADKQILLETLSKNYPYEIIESTFEQLVEDGYVDQDKLIFKEGILISVTKVNEIEDGFSYSVMKWRSGKGATGFDDGTIIYKNNAWRIEPGSFWVSWYHEGVS